LTLHNLWLYGDLVRDAREAIVSHGFGAFAKRWLEPR
jgi:queuine/archaeosine tRNA-ribosyltransferase